MNMKIRDYLAETNIEVGAELYSKDAALERLIQMQKKSGAVRNVNLLRKEVNEREKAYGSAVSGRIAISDFIHQGARHTSLSAITIPNGIDCGAPDKRPVKIIFMIAGKSSSDEHTEIKSQLMRLLSDPGFTARLCSAGSKEEFLSILSQKER